jgi:hypothetical protein
LVQQWEAGVGLWRKYRLAEIGSAWGLDLRAVEWGRHKNSLVLAFVEYEDFGSAGRCSMERQILAIGVVPPKLKLNRHHKMNLVS